VYKDRVQAGKILAEKIEKLSPADPVVLAIPRGGVVVAREVAVALKAPLDLVMSKKIGAPFNPEFAIAAVAPDGELTTAPGGLAYVSRDYIRRQAELRKREIHVRLTHLREGTTEKNVTGRTAILVDDGLATGLTALAAIEYIRKKGPKKIVLAVPVAPKDTLELLKPRVDILVCPLVPSIFYAVGEWYEAFEQVTDEEVKNILAELK